MPKKLLTTGLLEFFLLIMNALAAQLYEVGVWRILVPLIDLALIGLLVSLYFRIPISYFLVSVYCIVGTLIGFICFIIAMTSSMRSYSGTFILPLMESIVLLALYLTLHSRNSKKWFFH
ncbi:hypothetical protein [Methylosoma difficile]